MVAWSLGKYIFKTLCALATLGLLSMGLYQYILDHDKSVVHTRSFFETQDDVLPVMSMCFEQLFEDASFNNFGANITGDMYKNFLLGEYFREDLRAINYSQVTSKISDYIFAYSFTYRNGTHIRGATQNISWKNPYHTYSWESWGRFVKCFGIEITDKELYHLAIYLDRRLFSNRIRPQSNGFVVLFHYPNQILSSLHTVMRQWALRDSKSDYWMEFDVKNVDVIVRRYKRNQKNCIENWRDYDRIILEDHIESVGCRTPDQWTNQEWPICTSKEKMKAARLNLKPGGIRPCREIEAIDYVMLESEGSPAHLKKYSKQFQTWFQETLNDSHLNCGNKDLLEQTQPGWFSTVLRILDPAVKTTINKREMDIQSFVAYAGGYIGLFMGFSLAEIPEVLFFTLFYYRKLKKHFVRQDIIEVKPIP